MSASIQTIVGGAGNDTITPSLNSTGASVFPTDGMDSLVGLGGADSLDGGGGHDILFGGAGGDFLSGGGGSDLASCEGTVAVQVSLSGLSLATGDAVDDVFSGIEDLVGSSGSDTLGGNASGNVLEGRAGFDSLAGFGGNDVLDGGEQGDNLDGGEGNDTLRGGAGGDVLIGGSGADLLDGGDAAFANPEIYEMLEAEGYKYTIRLPANAVLQESVAWLLKRPVGRPPHEVRRYHASFSYRAGSWSKPRRVVTKVEWHPGELYPRVGFIVTNMTRPAERVVAFTNQRGTAEQHIKEGKTAVAWTRLSCMRFAANAVRLQLHALADNLANFLRTLALPEEVKHWSLSTLRDRLVKIGARIVRHGRSIAFQMAEVMVPRALFRQILDAIAALRPSPPPARC